MTESDYNKFLGFSYDRLIDLPTVIEMGDHERHFIRGI